VDAIQTHNTHTHDVNGQTDASDGCQATLAFGADFAVRRNDHTHSFSTTADNNAAGTAATEHDPTAQDVAHASADNVPAYYEVIFLKYLRQNAGY
jgi:hypothetical protein